VKFRIDRDVLADAVAWTARTLPVRPPVPVLAGMLIEAGDTLKLSSFDYEVSAQMTMDIDADEPGTALVSGRLLAEISRSLPAQPVEITTDGAKVTLKCGTAKFTLLTMPVEDYPSLPAMPPAAGMVGSDEFAAAVAQVAIAAGVRLEIEGETVTLASTDRYRLAVRQLKWKPEQPDFSAVALVPAKTLSDTAKSLTSGAEVSIALAAGGSGSGEGMIGFEGGGRRTTTRLLDAEFVKYQSLWPKETSAVAEVETGPFAEAVKRVGLVAEKNTPVRLSFREGEVVLEAGSGDDAQAVEVLGASLEGQDIDVAFNPHFLLDGLSAIGSDVARLAMTTSTKPAVMTGKPANDEDPDYRYLIMPIRLSS
jgi:DNA polymerase-3 subunit beta